VDISRWTDEQLMAHGWSYEQIQYQRSIGQNNRVVADLTSGLETTEDWYYEKPTPKSKKKIIIFAMLIISIAAGVAYWFL
tara:strand:+ start:675 stop:914 length:240 start_codon:yes stop_codon:yes gene_type:complete